MSKGAYKSAVAFRKIDVDLIGEENYDDDMNDDCTGPNITDVNSLLAKGSNSDALVAVLTNPPLNTKNQAVKDKALEAVLKVIQAFKSSEVDAALGRLDQENLDVLMKYLYRGFERPAEINNSQLLTWHDKVFSKTGVGSIIRVLSDRKKV